MGFSRLPIDLHQLSRAIPDLLILIGNQAAPEINLKQRCVARSKVWVDLERRTYGVEGVPVTLLSRFTQVPASQIVQPVYLRILDVFRLDCIPKRQCCEEQENSSH